MASVASDWEGGKSHEIAFWEHYFRTKGGDWPQEYADRMDPQQPLQKFLIEHLDSRSDAVEILDVGAGPLTVIGKVWPGHTVRITAVDALGDAYGQLYEKFGVAPAVRTLSCETEKLSERFSANRFDLVYIRNALDHGYDPLAGIGEMLTVVKPGGTVLLQHFANEAEKEGYAGFHQWNLAIENRDMIMWNKKDRFSLRAFIQGRAEITSMPDDGAEWVSVALRKL